MERFYFPRADGRPIHAAVVALCPTFLLLETITSYNRS